MNNFSNTLSNSVLGKQFDTCSLQELQHLTEKYPYTSALQFLYSHKLKQANATDYKTQAQKALLYFNNPIFINRIIEADNQTAQLIKSRDLATSNNIEPKEKSGSEEPAKTNKVVEEQEDFTDSEKEDTQLPPLPSFKIEAIDPANAGFVFTPYYTVDYFAAQGIKLGEIQNANDRFGSQLKSFTSWLKQMKRLPGANVNSNLTVKEEKTITNMAVQSLTGENANTEAMAEVWAKQGDINKAIETYKKLSLQIPAKSAYFAAKIEYLKK